MQVWDVLTAYEQLPEFVPNLAVSERLPLPNAKSQRYVRLRQVAPLCAFSFFTPPNIFLVAVILSLAIHPLRRPFISRISKGPRPPRGAPHSYLSHSGIPCVSLPQMLLSFKAFSPFSAFSLSTACFPQEALSPLKGLKTPTESFLFFKRFFRPPRVILCREGLHASRGMSALKRLRPLKKARGLGQVGLKDFQYMLLHAEAILDLVERPLSEIQFRQVRGDFDTLQGKWMLQAVDSEVLPVGVQFPVPTSKSMVALFFTYRRQGRCLM